MIDNITTEFYELTCFLPALVVVAGDPRLLLSLLEVVEGEEPSERRGVGMLELDELDELRPPPLC